MARTVTEEFTTVDDNYFQGGARVWKRGKNESGGGLADILGKQRGKQRGAIASARLAFSVNPTAADTVTIGGHEFRFVAALGAAAAHTQVKILGSAALTKAAFLDGINGATNSNVTAATTAFSASVIADSSIANTVRLRYANEQGNTAVAGAASSIALAASITAGATAWSVANLNAAGGRGMNDVQDYTTGSITITAAMITNTMFHVELPFTPTWFDFSVWDGNTKILTDDTVSIDGDAIKIALAGGAAPNLQSGNVVRFFAAA